MALGMKILNNSSNIFYWSYVAIGVIVLSVFTIYGLAKRASR
jgi:hypothetical protein